MRTIDGPPTSLGEQGKQACTSELIRPELDVGCIVVAVASTALSFRTMPGAANQQIAGQPSLPSTKRHFVWAAGG